MFAVFGLGNPGVKYLMTRHNAGFMVADKISEEFRSPLRYAECQAMTGKINRICGENFLLCKPITFMNLSGESIRNVMNKYHLELDQIIVIHDDLDLPIGSIRVKKGGGSGGHNGIKSITQYLKTPEYLRVRIGIDRPVSSESTVDYVLDNFLRSEHKSLKESIETAMFAVLDIIDSGFIFSANKFNKRIPN
ncbi:MAG: aminoacyl-tRNA hydrolase [Caldisericia bacterium]|nr:aminoacyl-tRNA hydrolase [Caldisericia bacterium]